LFILYETGVKKALRCYEKALGVILDGFYCLLVYLMIMAPPFTAEFYKPSKAGDTI